MNKWIINMRKKLIMPFKWRADRKKKINEIVLKTPKEVLDKRDELYKAYLEAERKESSPGIVSGIKNRIKALDWVLSRGAMVIAIFLLGCSCVFAASTKIEDRTQSGYKADVEKLGSKYGLGVSELAAAAVTSGRKVTNAGTDVPLAATSTTVKCVSIKALSTNTGLVYVGPVNVSSADGRELEAGESIDIDVNDLNSISIDVSVSTEGITWLAIN